MVKDNSILIEFYTIDFQVKPQRFFCEKLYCMVQYKRVLRYLVCFSILWLLEPEKAGCRASINGFPNRVWEPEKTFSLGMPVATRGKAGCRASRNGFPNRVWEPEKICSWNGFPNRVWEPENDIIIHHS
jgi:hypothetical protein